jgi:hypothetical protein
VQLPPCAARWGIRLVLAPVPSPFTASPATGPVSHSRARCNLHKDQEICRGNVSTASRSAEGFAESRSGWCIAAVAMAGFQKAGGEGIADRLRQCVFVADRGMAGPTGRQRRWGEGCRASAGSSFSGHGALWAHAGSVPECCPSSSAIHCAVRTSPESARPVLSSPGSTHRAMLGPASRFPHTPLRRSRLITT